MIGQIKKISFNQRLAVAVIVLALLAAVAGEPYSKSKAGIDLNKLAALVENEKDHIDAVDLADWIMQKKDDYVLVDISSKPEYDEYHIPTAVNFQLQKIVNEDFSKEKKIVIYSQGGIHGSQAWFFLKAKGYDQVYFLRYGLNEWIDDVLFPVVPKQIYDNHKDEYLKISNKAMFFGGSVELSDSVDIQKKVYRREGC